LLASTDWGQVHDTSMPSASTNPTASGSSKRPKKPDGHDKNPDWPKKEYTNACRPIAIDYYKRRSMNNRIC
jgi:hypothetical protein